MHTPNSYRVEGDGFSWSEQLTTPTTVRPVPKLWQWLNFYHKNKLKTKPRPVEKAAAQRLAICVDACTQSLPQHTGRRLKAKFCRQMNALRLHRDSLRIALQTSVE